MKIGTHLRLTPWKLHSVQGKKIKNNTNVSTLFRFRNIERLRIVQVSFNRSYVVHLAGHLRTAVLTDINYVACLRIRLETQCKQGQK